MRILRCIFLLLLFALQGLSAVKLPDISAEDAAEILGKMMQAHVSCKHLDKHLITRALRQYIEALDPNKVYLLQSEVEPWLEPSDSLFEEILVEMKRKSFAHFLQIHEKMVHAIERHRCLQQKIDTAFWHNEVCVEAQNECTEQMEQERSWALSEEELENKLKFIKELQKNAIQKLSLCSGIAAEAVFYKIHKTRLAKEEAVLGKEPIERHRYVLTRVLKAFASSFDPHTAYFTPQEAEQFLIQVQQKLVGIGVQLQDDFDGFTITKIIEGGPASFAHALKPYDKIIAVDAEPVVGLELEEVVELIRGDVKTSVTLTVLRDKAVSDISITRDEVIIQEARMSSALIPYADGVIVHIILHAFYQDRHHCASLDIEEALKQFCREHVVKGVLLDLRFNAGGVLPQAVAVTGLFINKGIVCSIKDNQGIIEHLRHMGSHVVYEGPLLVLTSKMSASASEIVAQTLQDYGRAIVVGDPHTYGKGTFQTFTCDAADEGKVNPKGEFKVTRGKYYTVSGKSPQLVGVIPDIVVGGPYSEAEIGEGYVEHSLENDRIAENFQDDLADLPEMYRCQAQWLYKLSAQSKLEKYKDLIPRLRKNSETRREQDKFYQDFLSYCKEPEVEGWHKYCYYDPQLQESIDIMKDLIVLLK